jgi:hypothetical protein
MDALGALNAAIFKAERGLYLVKKILNPGR